LVFNVVRRSYMRRPSTVSAPCDELIAVLVVARRLATEIRWQMHQPESIAQA
jgi:hypothetical protein